MTTAPRRRFLGQLGAAATALAGSGSLGSLLAQSESGADELAAETAPDGGPQPAWDMSWVDKLASAQYRVVFDGTTTPADTLVPDQAAMILDQFHEVYRTGDDRTRVVMVFRQLGTSIGIGDSIWERYPLGERSKMDDPVTKAPVKYNPFWKARSGSSDSGTKLETLVARGAIILVCNIAAGNVAASLARATNRDPDEVQADVRRNLVPGALLVPSGVFAVIRAQNAGCAFMRG